MFHIAVLFDRNAQDEGNIPILAIGCQVFVHHIDRVTMLYDSGSRDVSRTKARLHIHPLVGIEFDASRSSQIEQVTIDCHAFGLHESKFRVRCILGDDDCHIPVTIKILLINYVSECEKSVVAKFAFETRTE